MLGVHQSGGERTSSIQRIPTASSASVSRRPRSACRRRVLVGGVTRDLPLPTQVDADRGTVTAGRPQHPGSSCPPKATSIETPLCAGTSRRSSPVAPVAHLDGRVDRDDKGRRRPRTSARTWPRPLVAKGGDTGLGVLARSRDAQHGSPSEGFGAEQQPVGRPVEHAMTQSPGGTARGSPGTADRIEHQPGGPHQGRRTTRGHPATGGRLRSGAAACSGQDSRPDHLPRPRRRSRAGGWRVASTISPRVPQPSRVVEEEREEVATDRTAGAGGSASSTPPSRHARRSGRRRRR